MTTIRTLRGGCQCGRNMYIIQPPPDASEVARLLFDPAPLHRASLASPLPTYLRVPLAWYHSTTLPFFPDETHAMIHRSYEHPTPGSGRSGSSGGSNNDSAPATRRHFCGFCGTPLSFWSEAPPTEGDYIRLALGSLSAEDLDELDEWAGAEESDDEAQGEEDEEEEESAAAQPSLKRAKPGDAPLDRITSSTGIPWFDSLVEGSRLARHLMRQQKQLQQHQQQSIGGAHIRRHDAGSAQSADGSVQVEWEVLEWTEGDDEEDDGNNNNNKKAPGTRSSEPSPAKRARLGAEGEGEGEGDDGLARGKSSGAMEVEQ